MKKVITFDFIWIPASLGGHGSGPYVGMRTTIRWQRFIEAYLQCARDIECQSLTFDPSTLQGAATCVFTSDESLPNEWFRDGEQIELLNGFRVLAVGRITTR